MKIWIDGDACPKPIKHILFRAATKRQIMIMMVANHVSNIVSSPWVKRVVVSAGFDKADQYILDQIKPLDLVITADTLLAALVLEKKALALSPRGLLYTDNNIKQIVTMRNIHDSLRSSGVMSGGPSPLHMKDVTQFSNHLDRILTKYHVSSSR